MAVALVDVAARLETAPDAVAATSRAATVTVVLPTFNERDNVVAAVEAIRAAFATRRWEWEILVIDDDSPDRTWEVVERLGDPRVRCYRRLDRKGLSSAIVDGLSLGRGERLVVADADLQHDLARIPDLVAALDRHSLAVGTRYAVGGGTDGLSPRRLRWSRMATVACQVALGIRCSDPMSGFFAIRRAAFKELAPRLNPRGYKLLMELLHALHPSSVAEVPYEFAPRRTGDSKLLPQVMWDFALSLLELFSRRLISARFVKYAAVGLSGVVVQYVTFYQLWRQVLADEVATAAAIGSAACSNYLVNNWWTFSDRRHRGGEILRGLLLFCLISGAGAFINQAMTWYLHDRHRIGLVFTMAAGIAVATVWNYFLNLDLTWRGHARPE